MITIIVPISFNLPPPTPFLPFHKQSQLNDTARNLLRVWQSEKKETHFLVKLNDRVVAEEERAATLFRGNSLASKAMDQFMKMVAIPFLHKAIAYPVRCLFEDKRSCEVRPRVVKGRLDARNDEKPSP